MSASRPVEKQTISPLVAVAGAFEAHQAALVAELELLDERDRAIVKAIRAGARLEEVALAAAVSRAAVSKAARRTLPRRTGRGGPYSRRRGSAAALEEISRTSRALSTAREHSREAKHRRDEEITRAMREGVPLADIARAAGLSQASVSTIARSSVQATIRHHGAVASQME